MTREIICKDCGCKFPFSENQQSAYTANGFCEPKRCPICREEMKRKRASPYYGLEEVMANWVALPRRRNRVHYKPHIVGGFR